MQATDVRVRSFQKDVESVMDMSLEAAEGLRGVQKWEKRIDGVEEDMRQIRSITEQHVVGTEKKLRRAVAQKDVETTILHYVHDLAKHGLLNLCEPLESAGADQAGPGGSKARNHSLPD